MNHELLSDRVIRLLESVYPEALTVDEIHLKVSRPGETVRKDHIVRIINRLRMQGEIDAKAKLRAERHLFFRRPDGVKLEVSDTHAARAEIYAVRPLTCAMPGPFMARFSVR